MSGVPSKAEVGRKPRPTDPDRARKNVILALLHVLLVIAIVAGFVYVQAQK